MADLHQLHDRLDSVTPPRVKPHNFQITPQVAEEWRQELEAAMGRIAQVAKVLGADAEEMEREANLLAASTTMTRAAAMYHVAERRLNEARKEQEKTMDRELGKMPGLTFEQATENVKKNLEALSRPSREEQAKADFMEVYSSTIKRDGAASMLYWLDSNGFFEAPASTNKHLAQPGGLAVHSLNVYKRLLEITAREVFGGPATELLADYIKETVAVLGLLHDVCKVGVYHKENPFKAVLENKLDPYTFRDPFPLGHGEKSLFLITRHMALTEEEAMAIRWHMGAYDDAVKGGSRSMTEAMKLTPWVWRLQEADMCAAWIDERIGAGV